MDLCQCYITTTLTDFLWKETSLIFLASSFNFCHPGGAKQWCHMLGVPINSALILLHRCTRASYRNNPINKIDVINSLCAYLCAHVFLFCWIKILLRTWTRTVLIYGFQHLVVKYVWPKQSLRVNLVMLEVWRRVKWRREEPAGKLKTKKFWMYIWVLFIHC